MMNRYLKKSWSYIIIEERKVEDIIIENFKKSWRYIIIEEKNIVAKSISISNCFLAY